MLSELAPLLGKTPSAAGQVAAEEAFWELAGILVSSNQVPVMAPALSGPACLWLELVELSGFASAQSLLWRLDLLSTEHTLSEVLHLACWPPSNIVATSKAL